MKEFSIDRNTEGQRIDRYLSDELEDRSRSYIQKIMKEGYVKVNQKPVKSNYRLSFGDSVEVTLPEAKEPDIVPENIPLDILYEDQDIIMINKPKQMVVHPAPGHYSGTLVNALMYHCKDSLSGINGVIRPGIVHRIDKDTSGLLVIAKTPEAKTSLGVQFFNKTTHRSYNALVWGNFVEDSGTIEGNIGRDPKDRLRMAVFPQGSDIGKPAVTHYKVLERFGYVTLVECILETGRTHQIRAHMKHIGHPLFSDERYGGTEILRGERTGSYRQFVLNGFKTCPRQALHAKTLGFVHPRTKKQMDFTSDIPEDLGNLLEKWRRYTPSQKV